MTFADTAVIGYNSKTFHRCFSVLFWLPLDSFKTVLFQVCFYFVSVMRTVLRGLILIYLGFGAPHWRTQRRGWGFNFPLNLQKNVVLRVRKIYSPSPAITFIKSKILYSKTLKNVH